MSDLQQKVQKAIRDTLKDPLGAGSDLRVIQEFGVWLAVEGNLDVQHLASVVIKAVQGANK